MGGHWNGINRNTGKKLLCKAVKEQRLDPDFGKLVYWRMDCDNCKNRRKCALPTIGRKAVRKLNKIVGDMLKLEQASRSKKHGESNSLPRKNRPQRH